MPSKSKAQARLFAAAAHNPKFAKRVGIKQSVAKDFNDADAGTGILKKARGGRIAAAQQRGRGALSMATQVEEPKTASRTRTKRPARVAGMLAEADRTLAEGGRALARKYAGGGKVMRMKNAKGATDYRQRVFNALYNTADPAKARGFLDQLREDGKITQKEFAKLHMELGDEIDSMQGTTELARGGVAKYAEGGKVGPAVAALRRLAAKFEGELNMGDHDSARRTARQMDLLEPGSSQTAMDALSKGPNRATADKLATFAKGGKVRKAADLVKHSLELTSSPEHSIHDDLKGMLEDAGIPGSQHRKIKILDHTVADNDGEDFFHNADIEGPSHLISKLREHLKSEGLDTIEDVTPVSKMRKQD